MLFDDGTWEVVETRVPTAIVEQESQDAFIKWLYSPAGQRSTLWKRGFTAAFLWFWPEDVNEEEDGRDEKVVELEDFRGNH